MTLVSLPVLSLLVLLLAHATVPVMSGQSGIPSGCTVVLGDLNAADFPTAGMSQPADSTILFDYSTAAGSTVTVTALATELVSQTGPATIRLALVSATGALIAQGVAPITLTAPIAAGVYTIPLPTPVVLQPSTTYYIAQLTGGALQIDFGGPFSSPFFTNTPYISGFQSQYDLPNDVFVSKEAPVAGLDCPCIVGDPQFVGLLGQSYQVHGMDGGVYNLISDAMLQLNARFRFLTGGRCERDAVTGAPLYVCWSHPGTYLSAIGLRTAAGDTIVVTAGNAETGFESVLLNGCPMELPASSGKLDATGLPVITVSHPDASTDANASSSRPPLTLHLFDLRTLVIAHAGLYTLTIQNSDGFVNLLRLEVSSMSSLRHDVQSHGLIGQTWQRRVDGPEVAALQGYVDDYAEESGELLGCGVLYNKFDCSSSNA